MKCMVLLHQSVFLPSWDDVVLLPQMPFESVCTGCQAGLLLSEIQASQYILSNKRDLQYRKSSLWQKFHVWKSST